MNRKAKRKIKEQGEAAIQKPDVFSNDYRWQMTERKVAAEKEILERKERIANGHGEYSTLKSMKDFNNVKVKSKNLVVHVYPIPAMCGEAVDKYLSSIAPQRIETKFCKLDAELSRAFCDVKSSNSSTILMYKDSKMIDYIISPDVIKAVGSIEKFILFLDFYFSPANYEMRRFHNSLVQWIEETIRDAIEDSDDITQDINKSLRVVKN